VVGDAPWVRLPAARRSGPRRVLRPARHRVQRSLALPLEEMWLLRAVLAAREADRFAQVLPEAAQQAQHAARRLPVESAVPEA